MNRISTSGTYTTVLANLADSQTRQITAGQQISSQKIAQDFKGYAGKSETLTAMQSVKAKVAGLVDQNKVLVARFADQDTALNQITDATQTARDAIASALASGRVDTLMQQVGGALADATAGLNTKSQGVYLFAGGQVTTQPVSVTALSDLTAAPSIASLFHNDQLVVKNQIDETSSVSGGMLASNIGAGLMQAFKDVQAFQESGSGPFTGQITSAQRTFLEGELAKFDTEHTNLVNTTAQNGTTARRIDDAGIALGKRSDMLDGMLGDITNVNMAEAVSRLQFAQVAVQASAQVFTTLRSSSLLNYLPAQ